MLRMNQVKQHCKLCFYFTPKRFTSAFIFAFALSLIFSSLISFLIATARHYAASKNRLDIGKILIEKGADVNKLNNLKQTPM